MGLIDGSNIPSESEYETFEKTYQPSQIDLDNFKAYNDIMHESRARKSLIGGEEGLQMAVVSFLKSKYPDVITNSSLLQGNINNVGLSVKANQMGYCAGTPDLAIYEPCGKYHGLFIEFKNGKKGVVSPAQKEAMQHLTHKGYKCEVVRSYHEGVNAINKYMNDNE